MSFYNPATGEIVWIGNPSAYEVFHEWAHLEQQAENGTIWRAFRRFHRVPLVGKLLNVALEVDAAHRARRGLRECGILHPEDTAQAIDGVTAYFFDVFGGLPVFPPLSVTSTPASPKKT